MLTLEKLKEILSSKQNNKPIRLIELFAGYGSQSLALKYLGIPFEHHCICEWAVKSIQAYKDIHFPNDNTDYSNTLTFDEIVDDLFDKGISADYSKPMTKDQIKRMGEKKCRTCYNNIIATKNLVSITNTVGGELHIENTEKYQYIMTYSFPCQDLSNAGQRKGMEKGSGTRSGLLWEVERLLQESPNKPQILLMENVPQVHGKKNLEHFNEWIKVLESFGYKNYWKDLNAKNYGIPQSRNRCFMISLLKQGEFEFPNEKSLQIALKDILETNVDEKYFLSDKMLDYLKGVHQKESNFPRGERFEKALQMVNEKGLSAAITTNEGSRPISTFIKETVCLNSKGGRNVNVESAEPNLKRQLCNELIISGKVKENDVIRHSYSTNRMKNMYIQNKVNHECCSTLDLGVCVNDVLRSNNQHLKKNIEKFGIGDETVAIDTFNQTRNNCMQTIRANINRRNEDFIQTNYRIRKLTPKECFRLMGVKDDDFERVAVNQSNASLYHLAGDSIVVNVLMAIFEQLRKIIN